MELPSPSPPAITILRPLESATANPAYEALDTETNMPCVLLHANPGTYIILDTSDFPIVQTIGMADVSASVIHPTWFMTPNGYPAAHYREATQLLHRVLLGAESEEHRAVIHINGNHADNRRANLAYASQTQLNRRRPKPANRQKKAKPLPAGMVQTDLPRYCTYYYEKCYPFSPAKPRYRSFFRVEQHPLQLALAAGLIQDARIQPIYASTKAVGVPDTEKLAQAVAYADMLRSLVTEYPDIYERLEHYTRTQQQQQKNQIEPTSTV